MKEWERLPKEPKWKTWLATGIVIVFLAVIAGGAFQLFRSILPTSPAASGYCNRSTPYPISPDLARAWSLLRDRLVVSGALSSNSSVTPTPFPGNPVSNCVDIQYKDLSSTGSEGDFWFDPTSTTNDMHIYVDIRYKNYDDLLTAELLSHEMEHAAQFLKYSVTGQDEPCVQKEVEAFSEELTFFYSLNTEEKKSLTDRIGQNPDANSAYYGLYQLLTISGNAVSQCGGWQALQSTDTTTASNASQCYSQSTNKQIREMVVSNPFYQQECASELQTPTQAQ